jgi:hypothetical protein
MFNYIKKYLVATAVLGVSAMPVLRAQNLASYVNPFIGASTSTADAGVYHGLGKTFPGQRCLMAWCR